MSKSDYEEYLKFKNSVAFNYLQLLSSLFQNSVYFDGLPEDVPASFITGELMRRGRIVYLDSDITGVNGFYRGLPNGKINRYGMYSEYNCTTFTGVSVGVFPASQAHVLRANAESYPIIYSFGNAAESLADCDMAIKTNLLNSTSSKMIAVADERTASTVKAAYSERYTGVPLTVVQNKGDDIPTEYDTSIPFVADRIRDLRASIWHEILTRIGVVSSNAYKKERVQTAEVDASVGETIDFIYTLIDQFNTDAAFSKLPFRARLNTYALKFDEGEEK